LQVWDYGQEEIGECSKVVEARATSKTISSPSDSKKGIKSASPHQIKDNSGRYKIHSNSFLEYKKNDLCITSSNCDVAKHQMKKVWVKKTACVHGK
jgi:hypothetical protein